jgi:hypothetical protein
MVAVLSNRPEIHLGRKSQSDVHINGDSSDIPDFVSPSRGPVPEAILTLRRFQNRSGLRAVRQRAARLLTKSGFRDSLALESALEFPDVTQPLIDTLVTRRLLRIEDRAGIHRKTKVLTARSGKPVPLSRRKNPRLANLGCAPSFR